MEILVISVAAFVAAILTFFSGFGLGTILTPVFILFFPVEIAIALTGVVHFFNNIFKLILTVRNANLAVLLKFGIPAVFAAIFGSLLLLNLTDLSPLFSYTLAGKSLTVYPVKFIIAIVLLFFALADILPGFKKMEFGKDKLIYGGLLSGLFGGLSGNQGAFRSAFLIKAGLSKEAFIATGVVVACLVDFTRLSIYATGFLNSGIEGNLGLILTATLSAFVGAFIGNRLLKKVTLEGLRIFVAAMLVIISIALGSGLI